MLEQQEKNENSLQQLLEEERKKFQQLLRDQVGTVHTYLITGNFDNDTAKLFVTRRNKKLSQSIIV